MAEMPTDQILVPINAVQAALQAMNGDDINRNRAVRRLPRPSES
jgi:hypothetical protein